MKKLILLAAGALCALASPAQAVVFNLGVYPQPAGGSSPEAQFNFLVNTVLTTTNPLYVNYNAANDPDLPQPIHTGENVDVQTPQGGSSIAINLSGYEYLKLKWGDNWQYYYTANQTGNFTFTQPAGTGGISHYDQWNSTLQPGGPGPTPGVPDGGASVALLGGALAGLALLRRRLPMAR